MLLDLDLQTGDCALALNLRPTPGLREALANPLRIDNVFLDRAMAIHSERLFVLSAEEPLRADVEFTAEAVDTLRRSAAHAVSLHYCRCAANSRRGLLARARYRRYSHNCRRSNAALGPRYGAAARGFGAGGAGHSNLLVVNRSGEGGRRAMTLEEMAKVKLRQIS